MKRILFYLLLPIILLGLTQCKGWIYEPPIIATCINNSDVEIYMIMVDGDNPDTINLNDRLVTDFIYDYAPPTTEGPFCHAELTREEYIAQHPIQQIFICDAQKIEAAKWKIKPEFILKHFQADREWFEAHDWTITYP